MSISTAPDIPVLPHSPVAPTNGRAGVSIQDKIFVPAWIVDLDSYRRWAHSDDYPESGSVSYLDGEIWVDVSMEEIVTHNKVKSSFFFALMKVNERFAPGEFLSDGVLLTHSQAGLSTEPDALFYLWSTLETKKVVMVPGKSRGYMELAGTPDLVLEVVSESSVRKDTVILRDLYWRAGIAEYWLADARSETPSFEILRRIDNGYAPSLTGDNWQTSMVLGHDFRLVRQINRAGVPDFVVEARLKS